MDALVPFAAGSACNDTSSRTRGFGQLEAHPPQRQPPVSGRVVIPPSLVVGLPAEEHRGTGEQSGRETSATSPAPNPDGAEIPAAPTGTRAAPSPHGDAE
jgi:hypothetical protein